MSISLARALNHQKEWLKKLAPYPTRANWPSHLFHTCQLEVAVEIIKSGEIKCRDDVPKLICDVANQGALWNNPDAHKYVRLYFRPRNSFHFKTEGVKAIGDPYRVDPHMSVPIAFAFDFKRLMIARNVRFVPGNFAKTGAAPLTGDAAFDEMEFDWIYHDGPLSPDKMAEVHNWRMSEVVVPDSLSLTSLSCVVCRTVHEERTLRYALGRIMLPHIAVEQKGSIFMRRGMFMDEIYWADDRMHFKFHSPTGYTRDQYSLSVVCRDGQSTYSGKYKVSAGTKYQIPNISASKDAIWRVELEGCLVYHAPLPSASGLVRRS